MLCQNCNLNESTIHLYTSVNGKQRQVDLCQNCYQIMKSDPANSILNGLTPGYRAQDRSTSPFFDDFFGDLNNFRAFGNLPNTPPTQAGQNGNGGGRYGGNYNGQR
ncbi:TPA: ATP-dependent Clp protease ATP-binding subunit, partial [Streptococcus pyogenes]|nr:ATP-dependent Clp protease ATP-binding subunit [Streptococcus pyogenes]